MSRKRRQRIVGLLPRIGQWVWTLIVGVARHPQTLIALVGLVVALWALGGYVVRTEAFRITRVMLPPDSSFTLKESILHTNLWELDVEALAAALKQQQPWLQEVRVTRQLPDTLVIEPIERRPIAQVRVDRWYPVDGDGFILPTGSSAPTEAVTRLVGLERGGTALKVGKENSDERLRLALRVLQAARQAPALASRRLSEVNVADPQQLRFVVDEETEIRCGSEVELEAHLGRLQAAWKAIAKQQLGVRYIDVRFPEPVVAPRT